MAHQTGIEREFRHGSVITTVVYINTKLDLCVHVRFSAGPGVPVLLPALALSDSYL